MLLRLLCFATLVLGLPAILCGVEPDQRAARGPLDLIPAEAAGAIAIRNVAELTKRGDALLEETETKDLFRLSEAYKSVAAYLGVKHGLNDQGAAVLMALKPRFEESTFVLAVPVADVAAMAGNFKLTEKDLVDGKVIDRSSKEGSNIPDYIRYIALHQQHLYIGGAAKSVETALQAKPVGATLSAADRQALAEDDIVVYANRKQLGEIWDSVFTSLKEELQKLDEEESAPLRKLAGAGEELDFVLAGVRLETGLGASLLLQFDGDKSREVLTQLQGQTTPASLRGLPTGRVLAAHGLTSGGEASSALLRALLNKLPFGEHLVSSTHRPQVVGVFGEVWDRLQGGRTAVYENEHPERDGHFAFIAILDTNNSEQFVADLTSLAQFVNTATLSPDDEVAAVDHQTIAQLIGQLNDEEYRVRQLATTKLGLLGAPALPALEKAAQSTDPEVQFRAKSLLKQINARIAAQREDLLKADLLTNIKPSFAYFPKQETRAGRPIDFIQMQLRADESEYAPALRRFLGPQWNKLRMTTVGKQVIVLMGSNTALLEQTIENVVGKKAGLADDPRLATFRERKFDDRSAEFHMQLARTQQLAAAGGVSETLAANDDALTSLSIAIAPQRVRLNLFAPVSEIKSVSGSWLK